MAIIYTKKKSFYTSTIEAKCHFILEPDYFKISTNN